MSTRIVICVDLTPDHIEHAYRDLYLAMQSAGLEWESTNEWYRADGQRIDESDLTQARMTVFARENEEGARTCSTT